MSHSPVIATDDAVPAGTRQAAVTVRGLIMAYGTRMVLQGLDLTILPGQLFALLGPNGAGKTTTVEILEDYRRRTGGRGQRARPGPAARAEWWRACIDVVMQSCNDHARWRIGELVAHFASYYPPRFTRMSCLSWPGRPDRPARG